MTAFTPFKVTEHLTAFTLFIVMLQSSHLHVITFDFHFNRLKQSKTWSLDFKSKKHYYSILTEDEKKE